MRKICLVILVLVAIQPIGYGQKNDQAMLDSLLPALSRASTDTGKLSVLINIIYTHVNYKPEEGFVYAKQGLELAQKAGWQSGTARLKDQIGRLYWRTGKFEEALKNHFEALTIFNGFNDKYHSSRVLVAIGQDYLDKGNYTEASNYLAKALKVSEETNDYAVQVTIYDVLIYLYNLQGDVVKSSTTTYLYLKACEQWGNNRRTANAYSKVAINFQRIGNNDSALQYFKRALAILKVTGPKLEECTANKAIGSCYCTMKNYSAATIYFDSALTNANEVKDLVMLARVHREIGNMQVAKGENEEALKNYLFAENEFRSNSNRQELASLYTEIGSVYTSMNQYDKARKMFGQSMEICKSLNSLSVPMSDYYSRIELLDAATGNWKDAYQHFKHYIGIKDSTFDGESLKKLVVSQIQYENDKKDAIAKTEQEKKDIKTQEEVKRQRNVRNSAFAVLALVLLFSIVIYRQRNRISGEKKRIDALLADKELLLREIHHRVKNNLEVVSSLLALQSAQIDDPGTKEAMLEGQNRVHSIGIVHQKLYLGENLGFIEMKDYFINLSESILDSFGAEGRVSVEFAMEKLNVDIDTAVPLGLIVNELLTNTLKYAFPDNQHGLVRIKLEKQTSGILHLEVSDNGVGKSGITQGSGFGGQLIALLTRQLNGSMKEELKNGTAVFFDFKTEKVA